MPIGRFGFEGAMAEPCLKRKLSHGPHCHRRLACVQGCTKRRLSLRPVKIDHRVELRRIDNVIQEFEGFGMDL